MWVKQTNKHEAALTCWHYAATYVRAVIAFNFEVISTKVEMKVYSDDTNRPEKSVHFMLPLCGYINLLVSNITIIQDNPIEFII